VTLAEVDEALASVEDSDRDTGLRRRVLSRERLLDLANARDPDAFDRAIDRITRIRCKVEPGPNHPRIIRTIRGAGYVFSPDGQEH
jgi:DNA-binding response OmpR family regulator